MRKAMHVGWGNLGRTVSCCCVTYKAVDAMLAVTSVYGMVCLTTPAHNLCYSTNTGAVFGVCDIRLPLFAYCVCIGGIADDIFVY